MARKLPEPGRRVSVRRVRHDGEIGDVIGFVLAADDSGLTIRDRRGHPHQLLWEHVVAWRQVGVARGRDPLRAPRAELDALAEAAGVHGRVFVARLSDLLDAAAAPAMPAFGSPPPGPAVIDGEWVTTGEVDDLLALAWWAAHHDARSIQVRTEDDASTLRLIAAGLTER